MRECYVFHVSVKFVHEEWPLIDQAKLLWQQSEKIHLIFVIGCHKMAGFKLDLSL